ncbi:hypothetical protein I4U23_019004 [Adineta vaga]|nr:hypothetical protein I4U23_019004 [Adineta vaga]
MSDTESDVKSEGQEVEKENDNEEEQSLHNLSATPSYQDHISDVLESSHEPTKPDITIICSICERYVNVNELTTHMMYHNALRLFRFKEPPDTIEILLKQRDVLIQRMQHLELSDESYLKHVKTINDTFQILRRKIEPDDYFDDPYIYENNEASTIQGISFIPRNRLFLSIGVCTSQNKQFKVEMEDTMRYIDCFGGNEANTYIGLFDGYNGKAASTLCRDHLHEAVLLEMSKLIQDLDSSEVDNSLINRLYTRMIDPLSNNYEIKDIGDVYHLSYLKMDHFLTRGLHETSKVRWSGTSTLTAVITMNDNIDESLLDLEEEKEETPVNLGYIHIANCGNVEALGIRTDKAFLLTQKHTLNTKRERVRVLETGVKISENELIDGVFETTRGLGNHGDKDLKKSTEGLWEALSYDLVVEIVTQCLPSHDTPLPNRTRTAVQSVLEKYDPSRTTPCLPNEDDIVACMDEILDLFEEHNEDDEMDKTYFSSIRHRRVQCSENGIQQDVWNSLPEKYRFRLELAQIISERLVSAALLAQSKSNISVICLLLPGAIVI